jgi:hypothetical protein
VRIRGTDWQCLGFVHSYLECCMPLIQICMLCSASLAWRKFEFRYIIYGIRNVKYVMTDDDEARNARIMTFLIVKTAEFPNRVPVYLFLKRLGSKQFLRDSSRVRRKGFEVEVSMLYSGFWSFRSQNLHMTKNSTEIKFNMFIKIGG